MDKLIDQIPESLDVAMRDHRCVPFIGAGLSYPFGIPTWRSLLDALSERCIREKVRNPAIINSLIDEGEFTHAAFKAKEKLGKDVFREVVTDLITNYDRSKELLPQKLLWDISPGLILTTNFDTLLEDSVQPHPDIVTHLHKSKLADLIRKSTDSRVLFKLHGTIDEFESLVFTEDDYSNLYNNDQNAYLFTFSTSIIQNNLLFIGFSFSDQSIIQTLKSMKKLFNDFTGKHYALVKEGDHGIEAFWRECNVTTLFYHDYDEIEEFLKHVSRKALSPNKKETHICVSPGTTQSLRTPSGKLNLPPSESIPEKYDEVLKRAIGECIILACPQSDDRKIGWSPIQVNMNTNLSFYKPKGVLNSIQRNMDYKFRTIHSVSTPRYSLREYKIEPKQNYNFGGIQVDLELTDWSLIHGIQTALASDTAETVEVRDLFWKSVHSLVTICRNANYPHHIAMHSIVISKDLKVVINKRTGVENQKGRISASFEEQMQFPFIYPASEHKPHRFFDGDESLVATAVRGAEEELNINISPAQIRLLALCMESTSVAANFLSIIKSDYDIDEIYNRWQIADDKAENLMVPPNQSPKWDLNSMLSFISSDQAFENDPVLCGPWHASSRVRILFGLIHDFGYDAVAQRFDFPDWIKHQWIQE